METKVIKVESDNPSLTELSYCAEIIRNGGLVVFPTETVYGLGADGTNPSATEKIYNAKGRPSDNPLIIHISDIKDAEKYAFVNSTYYLLAEQFMPGPLTVVLPSKDTVPLTTRGGLTTVAVRCPENKIAHELIRLSGVPIAAPSANLSGSPSPTSVNHVIDDMYGRVDAIIDGGNCDFGLESTIVKIDADNKVTLLRPGKITVEDIEALGISVTIASAVTASLADGETAISPGMKYKHYAPKSTLVLLDGDNDAIISYIKANCDKKVAIIAYTEYLADFSDTNDIDVYDFGYADNNELHAHLLFKILRETDKKQYDVIYAPVPKISGIGLALYNRMIRAAAHKIIRL